MRVWMTSFLLVLMASTVHSRETCDLLIWPVLGVVPPEMRLPEPDQISEQIRLKLPKGMVVLAEEPTGRVVPEDIQGLARNRAKELRARMVIWGELQPPGRCRAPRVVRLNILDLKADILLQRELCPGRFFPRQYAQAVFKLTELTKKRPRRFARSKACPEPKPCPAPECPRSAPEPGPGRARILLAAGALVTSHPRWDSAGVGVAIELIYSPRAWLETGLGVQAVWSRRIDELLADYSSWPVNLWGRLKLGESPLEGLLDLGLQATFTRLQEAGSAGSHQRVKPAVFVRLGVRWLPEQGPGFQILGGTTAYLAGQSYGDYSMPWYSFELIASLVTPI